MAELAVVLPIVMLVLMGVIQFGLILSAFVGATNVAREVARYGSVCVVIDGTTAASCGNYTTTYLNQVLPQRINAAEAAGPPETGVAYCSYDAPKADPADPDRFNVRLTVSVGARYPLFIPLIGNLVDGLDGEPGDGRFLLRAQEAMRVEGGALAVAPGGMPSC